jgi:hypothetical protein
MATNSLVVEHTITDAERIAALRRRCMDRKSRAWRDTTLAYAESLQASAGEPSWQIRKGYATRDILRATQFEIDDLELLVGRLAPPPPELEKGRREVARRLADQHPLRPGGQTGHAELDLSELYRLGIDGLIAKIQATAGKSASPSPAIGRDGEAAWRSFVLALQGLSTMIEHAAETAAAGADDLSRQLTGGAEGTDARKPRGEAGASLEAPHNHPDESSAVSTGEPVQLRAAVRQSELQEMAAICRRIAHHPPETFRQAIQLHWFATFAVQHGEGVSLIVPGRLDRSLRPFYEADIASGRLTRDEALLLIESLYLLINEFVPDGLAVSVMVGGRDAAGPESHLQTAPVPPKVASSVDRRWRFSRPPVGTIRRSSAATPTTSPAFLRECRTK